MENGIIIHNETFIPVNKEIATRYKFANVEFYVRNQHVLNTSQFIASPTKESKLFNNHTVFLKKKDYPTFLRQLFNYSKNAPSNSPMKDLNINIEALFYSFKNFGTSADNIFFLKSVSESISEVYAKDSFKEIIELLVKGEKIHQSLFCALFCRMMANNIGWTSPSIIQKLIIAAFLSHVGESALHSFELLDKTKSLPDDTLLAIRSSQENQDGSGLLGIKKVNIHPLSKLIRVSNEFYPYFSKKQIAEGLWHLKSMAPEKLDSQSVVSAIKVFQKVAKN